MLRLGQVKRAIARARAVANRPANKPAPTVTKFWTDFNVTEHHNFRTAEESLDYFDWRSGHYFDYLSHMPVAGHDGKVILDYVCGPGHDLVGFGHFSKPARLVGADISESSLAESRFRLGLHRIPCELVRLDENKVQLPFPDATFDHIASSGVLHHVSDLTSVLRELRRVLKPSGELRIMIYNYDSLFLHLHTAYIVRVKESRMKELSLRDAFRELTDAPGCPISHCYRPQEFVDIVEREGFRGNHVGNALSAYELQILPLRGEALQKRELPREHRDFLRELRLDDRGLPKHGDHLAGIDGCYRFSPA